MSLSFRPAQPGDADQAVPLIYSSGPAAFDYVFRHPRRGSAEDFLRSAFSSPQGEFSYRLHQLALLDGRVVACGMARAGGSNLAHTLAALGQILRFYGPRHAAGVIRRGLQVERTVQPPKAGVFYLGHLGVDPALRAQGLGQALILELLRQGLHQGLPTAALDVAASNPRAEALYTRLGFRTRAERPAAVASITPHRYMERPLREGTP
ncbi:MAG: N-acetyltransferase [Pseudomonas sp.]|uniref:GNAT family N-acetyltransferase n=1 Tax=Pseudomonas sp. TaxID=306 RepID=UPI003392A60A